ncbi:glycosyltransferase family 4 protein [Kineothrix sp. MB12-C1]|uniref:glycosyltransferase family 4 protein n=1 Tax=Kineothrix sp. MB12-C1 TaxID=3070215 RepID=UPI0027D34030|nr:glycosyltransferase family 4 protein [Kineothrix sp. MB12-C1]WMC91684.1 glycosyltransferase family 4 protein [Kineothrix sp. MB12-C1]
MSNRKKHKKIAMIGHKRIPSREGGVEIVVDELSTRLVERSFFVDAYNRSGYHVSGKEFDEKRGKVYNGVNLITIPTFKNSKLNAIVYSFLATIRALFGGYNAIHYHAEGPCAMIFIPKLFGIRVVATIHGLDWQRAKWGNFASKVLKFGEAMAAKYADEVIVLSKNVQDYFKDTYQRETAYIPNGISRPEIKEPKLIKEKLGLEKDGYILFLARLVPEKGIHYLIRAFKKIDTDKKLVIAGGNSHAVEYVEKIRKMAEKDERIIFTGFVQGRELEELYSNAYVFVLPSDIEGMAISLLEAMSYSNCCLVSDIRENMEVVEDKAASFRQGSVESLRKELERLIREEAVTAHYKAVSGDFICNKYSWDDVVDKTIKLYLGNK